MNAQKFIVPLSKSYLLSFVCLGCRKSFKRPFTQPDFPRKCPQCGKVVIGVGRHFKPPKITNDKQWEKVRLLATNGFVFQKLYDEKGNSIPYPKTLNEAKEFIVKFKDLAVKLGQFRN